MGCPGVQHQGTLPMCSRSALSKMPRMPQRPSALVRQSPSLRCRVVKQQKVPAPRSSASGSGHVQTDVVVIGSGIGGLCCAAMLAKYGLKVVVCEVSLS